MNATQVDTHFWYEENRDGIVARHNGRWVVLSDCAVAGDFATEMDALRYAMGKFGKGRFLIKKCVPASEEVPVMLSGGACF